MKHGLFSRPSSSFSAGKIILFTLMALLLASCSTKKNTLTRRLYHNLTAHYNAYWNGRQSIKEGEAELYKAARDNYSFILPVFNYGTKEQAVSVNPQMDRAIEKGSKVIQKHSMFFNNKEYVNWINDSYLMIGEAYFYKQEYLMARRTFDYIIKNFEDDPIRYEAMIWLASSYIQQQEWNKAQSLLDLVQSEIDKEILSLKMVRRLPLVYADFYIKQQLYKQAIPYLERGLEINHDKITQCRVLFILGQIYQADKDYEASSEYYTMLIKRGAPYEMAFNARINLAQTYSAVTGDKKMIIKQLQKMIKDLKNEDFLDQIYFALAEIALKDNDDSLGIQYLKLSVRKSTSNLYQKSISSLRLADLFFSYPDYPNAQLYYDTAVMFLPADYPNYDPIVTKAGLLTELVTHLNTIRVQDSLQVIARMPENERMDLINKMIADYQEKERVRKEQEALLQNQIMMASSSYQTQQNVDRLAGGKWYFYNPSTLSFGYNEFLKKWGNRKLEDLWRLKNKQVISMDQQEEMAASDSLKTDSTAMLSTDPLKAETYLQNLPLTDELMDRSNQLIANALYQSGIIYDDGLSDFPMAIESYRSLIDRYPSEERVLQAYYNLYSIFTDLQDSEHAAFYRDLIVNNYPESDYAKIIVDPNYSLVLQAQRNKAAILYEETYQAYLNEQYMMVKIYSEEAIANYPEDKVLIPKFEYLRLLAIGRSVSRDSLSVMLQQFIGKYPSHEVTPLAQNVLNHLNIADETLAENDSALSTDSLEISQKVIAPYVYEPETIHFYILVVDAERINVNATKVKISDHNQKYHSLDNLTISSVLLDNKRQMITVSNFRNRDKALTYYAGIRGSDYVFSNIPADAFSQFVISSENYRIFYENKDARDYLRFFNKNYLTENQPK
ncbi:MAG: tetratricopeptide repeat protein [Bacteroidales bacterium]|nr:tetratricopeptide repeat protein [Lentimicrobiaceae bacterium]MDD5694951.1 tetratricopeptide repeat protein [Bacteroidales bacterium]